MCKMAQQERPQIEVERAAHIQRNKEVLTKLGLLSDRPAEPKAPRKVSSKRLKVFLQPSRRSDRVRTLNQQLNNHPNMAEQPSQQPGQQQNAKLDAMIAALNKSGRPGGNELKKAMAEKLLLGGFEPSLLYLINEASLEQIEASHNVKFSPAERALLISW